jgi:hypothetical protein
MDDVEVPALAVISEEALAVALGGSLRCGTVHVLLDSWGTS